MLTILIGGIVYWLFGDKATDWVKKIFNSKAPAKDQMPQPPPKDDGTNPLKIYGKPGDWVFAKGDVNVRQGAGTNHPLKYKAGKGDFLGVVISLVNADGGTSTSDKWYKINAEDVNDYSWSFAYAPLCVFAPPDAPQSAIDSLLNMSASTGP